MSPVPVQLNATRAFLMTRAEQHMSQLAQAVSNEAVRLAPVDTGELRQSLRARKVAPKTWRISASAPHALFVEFGTRRTRAQPYLRPALRAVVGT